MNTTKRVARFGNVWQLLEYSNFQLTAVCNLPFMSGDYVESDGYIVVGISGDSLIIFIIDDYLKKGELTTLNLPSNFVVHSLVIGTLSERRIYIGGETKHEGESKECQSMYYIDLKYFKLNCSELELEPFPLPEELKRPGKAIDDIGLYGYKIYVLDNIILPKFLYIFSVRDLDLQEVVSLYANGTYESFYRIAINFDYIVTLSSTVGDGGSQQHLSFYSRENTKFISALTVPVFYPFPALNDDLYPKFNDLLLFKNNLIIAADEGGVVKFDLNQDSVKDLFELKGKKDEGEDGEFDLTRWEQTRNKEKEIEKFKKDSFSRPFIGSAISVRPLYIENDDLKAILVTIFDREIYRSELMYIRDGELL